MPKHTTPQDIPLKRCTKCGEEKPATPEFFVRNKRSKSGIRSKCKVCQAEYSRAYHVAHKEQKAATFRAWRMANREYRLEYLRTYRLSHKSERTEQFRQWRIANRDRVNTRTRRRRSLKRNAEGDHTASDIKNQYKRQKGRCHWCGVEVGDNYHVDHIVPLSRGGSNRTDNLVISCPACNTSKGDKLPHEWPQGNRLL